MSQVGQRDAGSGRRAGARGRLAVGLLAVTLLAGAGSRMAEGPTIVRFSHGMFEDVPLYLPEGPVQNVVLLLNDRAAGEQGEARLVEPLLAAGALVAVLDTEAAYAARPEDDCFFIEGDLDNFARNLQGFLRLPTPHTAILAGEGEGAGVAYAMGAQAPAGVFLGTLTLDFCPTVHPPRPFCKGEGDVLRAGPPGQATTLLPAAAMPAPWQAVQTLSACPGSDMAAFAGQVPGATLTTVATPAGASVPPAWGSGYASLAALAPPVSAPPAAVADLPLIEVPLPAGAPAPHTLALLISGDGGWADIDRVLAQRLGQQGMRVLGVDALRYFWGPRTPEGLASDLDRVLQFYLARWQLDDIVLIGFSQGADVLPFALNRLPQATRDKVRRTVLLSPGKLAAFEFRVSNWLSSTDDGLPTMPEIERLAAGQAVCVYGAEDEESACPPLAAKGTAAVRLPGGHHFDEDYATVAKVIVDAARQTPGAVVQN